MEIKEQRIRNITQIYYSKPEVQKVLLEFGKNREVVPRYFEGFGKRPDILQYPSDIFGLVKKGATSFHASEEIWTDPLQLNSEINRKEMDNLRKSWDLLIDIDSKYLDVSKTLTLLILETFEQFGIKNYNIKFSGSKGFHIIISGNAFPQEHLNEKMSLSFPEWPRAICEYLTHITRKEFNKRIGELFSDQNLIEKRLKDSKDKIKESLCPNCGRPAKKGTLVKLICPECGLVIQRKDMKITKRRLKCSQQNCPGVLEISEQKHYHQCEYCEDISSINKMETSGRYKATFTDHAKESETYKEELKEEYSGAYFGASDLILVAPRHLFRMPYSLHEKTALASIVLKKEEIQSFTPRDADPLTVKIKEFFPKNTPNEGQRLLSEALAWKKERLEEEGVIENKKYSNKTFSNIEIKDVPESAFPPPIKKLLQGLEEGRKRGLFVLLTFLKILNFSPDYINKKVRTWNEKNTPPLREGYIKSQINWHLRQKNKILPPNYDKESFYRDIGLISKKPNAKNPIVEVLRNMRE